MQSWGVGCRVEGVFLLICPAVQGSVSAGKQRQQKVRGLDALWRCRVLP